MLSLKKLQQILQEGKGEFPGQQEDTGTGVDKDFVGKSDQQGKDASGKQPDKQKSKKIDKKSMRLDMTLTNRDKDDMDKVPANGKTLTGEPASKIDVDPQMEAVIVVGQMMPPTIRDQRLVEAALELAEQRPNACVVAFLTQNTTLLSEARRVAYVRRAFGEQIHVHLNPVIDTEDAIEEAKHLGYKRIIALVPLDEDVQGTEAMVIPIQVPNIDDLSLKEAVVPRLKMFLPLFPAHFGNFGHPVLSEDNILDVLDISEARAEEPYAFSPKEKRSLDEKACVAEVPVSILETVFRRGIATWLREDIQHLTHQQYAFNRVNSFLAGGAAVELDSDLAEQVLMGEDYMPEIESRIQDPKQPKGVIISPTPTSKFDGSIRLKDPESKVDPKNPKKDRPGKMSVQTLMRLVYEGQQLVNEHWNRDDPSDSGYFHGYHDRHMSHDDLMAKFPHPTQQKEWHEAHRRGTADRVLGKPRQQ